MITFSGAPTKRLAARLMIDAFCLHSGEQNFRGLILKPPRLNRLKQIGLPQTASDCVESGDCTACTLSRIDALSFMAARPHPLPSTQHCAVYTFCGIPRF